MLKRLTGAGIALMTVLAAGSGGAFAQSCFDRVGESAGPTREAALRQAYVNVLGSIDPALTQNWSARNLRIGEAPGYTVNKLSTKCTAGGQGQVCRIEATLCRS